jgi:hypothetical protein
MTRHADASSNGPRSTGWVIDVTDGPGHGIAPACGSMSGGWRRMTGICEQRKGPLAHGFGGDQRWTLGRIKALIGKLFHVGYTVEGTWKLMRRHGWSCQVPVRQAMERDDAAVAVWTDQVWPDIKAPRVTWVPSSASRTRQARG